MRAILRTPLETNPAFLLLTSRQQAIANHRQTMAGSLPAEPTLADLEDTSDKRVGSVNRPITSPPDRLTIQ